MHIRRAGSQTVQLDASAAIYCAQAVDLAPCLFYHQDILGGYGEMVS
jgi:hypothetical protein